MATKVQPLTAGPKMIRGDGSVFVRACVVWLLFMAVETLHGTIRVLFLEPVIGAERARLFSFFTGAALMFLVIYILIGWIGTQSRKVLLQIGVLWVVLTFGFEMMIGHFLGRTWQSALEEFNPFRGGIMFFGMLFLLAAPLIAARLHARRLRRIA